MLSPLIAAHRPPSSVLRPPSTVLRPPSSVLRPHPVNQFLAPIAEPIGALWCLMLLGVIWLIWRRQWQGAVWLGVPAGLIFLIGSTPLVDAIVARAERPWVGGLEDRGRRDGTQMTEGGGRSTEDRGRRTEEGISAIGNDPQLSTLNPPVLRSSTAEGGQPSVLNPPVLRSSTAEGGQPADVVVALGGGYYVSEHDMFGFALDAGGSRVLTALELVRRGKARALVLGGSVPLTGKPGVAASSLVQEWVLASGMTTVAVTNLGLCANTHDEALRFKELSAQRGWRKVILVTSALHIPRSVAVFAAQGIAVVPVACDFQAYGVPPVQGGFSPFPRQSRFHHLALYLHEKIGWWVYRAKGWV